MVTKEAFGVYATETGVPRLGEGMGLRWERNWYLHFFFVYYP